MASPYECFQVGVDDGIDDLQLSRPEKANSLTRAFWNELLQAVDHPARQRVSLICAN